MAPFWLSLLSFTVASIICDTSEAYRSILPSPIKVLAERILLKRLDIKVFDDVGLPDGMTPVERIKNLFQLSFNTNIAIGKFILRDKEYIEDNLVGDEKVDPDGLVPYNMSKIQTRVVNSIIKTNIDEPDPVRGYRYFGNKEFGKALGLLCQTNPFFACALTATEDDKFLELKAYSPKPESAKDPLYLSLMREMTDPSHHINVKFNLDMTIRDIEVFNNDGTSNIIQAKDVKDIDYFASGVIYNLFYFASAVHATIHYLHYLMTAGIVDSTEHNEAFAAWSDPYDNNIAVKFVQVAALLFYSTRNGKPFPSNENGSQDGKLVTGKNGFGANENILPTLRVLLCRWGRCKSTEDYMDTFIFKDLRDTSKNPKQIIKEAGLLTEFQKHIDNIDSFSDDMSDAMKKHNVEDFKIVEEKLKIFSKGLGGGVSNIDTISSWIKLMSCTGLTHGCTLSYTRAVLIPEVMRWRNIQSPTWDDYDAALITGATGTLQGMTPGRHVFSNKMPRWNSEPMTEDMKAVLLKYNTKAEDLKVEYQDRVRLLSDFRDFGWIKTDFCPDGFDGKQATITTYI